jgi:ATP-dependent 26S proteasome regulatory subunit
MNDLLDLFHLIKSRVPIITIETRDEKDVLLLINDIGKSMRMQVYGWDVIRGFSLLDNSGDIEGRNLLEPREVLLNIYNTSLKGIFILLDFHPYLQDDRNIRLLKELASNSERLKQTIILVSAQIAVPNELKHLSAKYEMSFPDRNKIKQFIYQLVKQWQEEHTSQKVQVDETILDAFINNLRGLSFSEIKRITYNALIDHAITEQDIPELAKAKYNLLNKDNVLYYEHDTSSFAEVGGLNNLKEWLEKRKQVFLSGTEIKIIDIPKGILLLGVQGCGKSLAAKSVAGTWGIPLLRLDFGTLYNKFYGETERKIREALKMADRMAPCVLWIDEIEKGLASESNDSGTSKRVLGTLLTWMSERKSFVFLVATANDIQNLPPELLRKGRMDEIFFVDLPDQPTRKIIFEIHLKKRELESANFDLELISKSCEGFSGSEIEQVIVSGFYSTVGGYMQLDTQLILDEITKTKSLSVVMEENISMMREWAKDRTVPAN